MVARRSTITVCPRCLPLLWLDHLCVDVVRYSLAAPSILRHIGQSSSVQECVESKIRPNSGKAAASSEERGGETVLLLTFCRGKKERGGVSLLIVDINPLTVCRWNRGDPDVRKPPSISVGCVDSASEVLHARSSRRTSEPQKIYKFNVADPARKISYCVQHSVLAVFGDIWYTSQILDGLIQKISIFCKTSRCTKTFQLAILHCYPL